MTDSREESFIQISAKDGSGVNIEEPYIPETELFSLDFADIDDADYFAVCANMWCKDGEICMCNFIERIGRFGSYKQAKVYIDANYNGKRKCPKCGFSHFRAREYKALAFDNEYVSMCFNINSRS